MAEQLQFLVTTVTAIQKKQETLELLVTRVNTLEDTVRAQSSTLDTMAAEIKQLKDEANRRNQQDRSLTVRLFNFPGSDSETGLAARIYDRLLKPILKAAKASEDTPTVPQLNNVIIEAFRAGRFSPGANKPPPPVIIKLASSQIRLAILLHKRLNMPLPNEAEKEAGAKRYYITEDLTTPTYRKFKELLEDERVEKAWTRDGIIFVVKKGATQGAKQKPILVKSVYDANDLILS